MFALIPTVLFAVIIILQTIFGFLRGKRKSIYYFINFIIAFILSVIIYYSLIGVVNTEVVLSPIKDAVGATEGDTIAEVLLNYIVESSTDPSFVDSAVVTTATLFINMIVNFVIFLFVQIIVYRVVKFILFVLYMIIFGRKVKELNEDEGTSRGVGALIGAFRGVITGFLIFSQFSTLFFILSGGVFYTAEEYEKYVQEDIFFGYDDIYQSLKTSRDSGLGKIFEGIKINGVPIDYLFMDFVLQDDFTNYQDDKLTILGREELGYTIGIITKLYESGIIGLDSSDNFIYDLEKATPELATTIFGNMSNVQLITQVIPTLLLNDLDSIGDIPFALDKDSFKDVNFASDISAMGSILSTLLQLVDFSSFEDFKDFDFLDLDADLVDTLINDICQITILTQIAIPLGVDYALSFVEDIVFDLESIYWNDEIQNLKGLYGLVQDLNLDFEFISDFDYLLEILEDETKVAKMDDIVSQIFNSDFIFELSTKFFALQLDSLSESSDIIANMNIDMSNYKKTDLQEDVSLLVNTIVEGVSIYSLLTEGELDFDTLFSMDLTPVEEALVGKFDNDVQVEKGLMDLNILKNAGNEFYSSLFTMVPMFEELLEDVYIDSWKTEFRTMFQTLGYIQKAELDINALMEGDLSALTPIDEEVTEDLIVTIQKSTLMSTLFVGALSDTLGEMEIITIPENLEWYGQDNELDSLLRTVFFFVNEGLISDFMSGDTDTIVNCILSLSEDDLNVVCNSKIIHATLSNQISVLTENTPIIIDEDSYTGEYINISEVVYLLDFLTENNITDFSSLDIESISIFNNNNIQIINDSTILRKTVVNQVVSMEDMISIPLELRDYNNSAWYGVNGELNDLLISLQSLFGDGTIGDLTFDLDELMSSVFDSKDQQTNSYTIFNSSVIQFTLSEQLSTLGGNLLVVPESVYELSLGSQMISSSELDSLLNALDALDLTNFNDIDVSTFISNQINYDELFASNILSATVSVTIEDLDVLEIPSNTKDGDYIKNEELVLLMESLVSLGITDFDSLDVSTFISNQINYEELFASNILSATVSVTIEDLDVLEIPLSTKDGDYIKNKELVLLMESLVSLGITDFDSLDVSTFISDNIDYEELFASNILSATVSVTIEDLDVLEIPSSTKDGDYIKNEELVLLMESLVSLGITDFNDIDLSLFFGEKVVYDTLFDSTILAATTSVSIMNAGGMVVPTSVFVDGYITKDELVNLMEGLKALGLDSFDNTNSDSIYSGLDSISITKALESEILYYTISQQMVSSLTYVVTKYDDVDVVETGSTIVGGSAPTIIIKDEIVWLLEAIEELGIDLSEFGEVTDSILSDLNGVDIDTLVKSSIMAAQLSQFINVESIPSINKYSQDVVNGDAVQILSKEDLTTLLNL